MVAVASFRQQLADLYKTFGGSGTAWVSLHTADPTTTGGSEASGGSPAYARKQITWTSGTGGVLTAANVTFDAGEVGQNRTYTHLGLWTAVTGGTYIDKSPLAPNITLNGQGTITVTPSFKQD